MEICVLLCWFSGIFAMLGVLACLWADLFDTVMDQRFMVEERAERYEAQAASIMAYALAPEVRALKSVIQVCLSCDCDHKEVADLNREFYFLWKKWSFYRDLARPHFIVSY